MLNQVPIFVENDIPVLLISYCHLDIGIDHILHRGPDRRARTPYCVAIGRIDLLRHVARIGKLQFLGLQGCLCRIDYPVNAECPNSSHVGMLGLWQVFLNVLLKAMIERLGTQREQAGRAYGKLAAARIG